MSVLTDAIAIAGDPNEGAAVVLRALMRDGPNFKLGYTPGNAYAAVMGLAEIDGVELEPMLLIDKAFSKPPDLTEAKAALNGDSNDAEHDALYDLVMALDPTFTVDEDEG